MISYILTIRGDINVTLKKHQPLISSKEVAYNPRVVVSFISWSKPPINFITISSQFITPKPSHNLRPSDRNLSKTFFVALPISRQKSTFILFTMIVTFQVHYYSSNQSKLLLLFLLLVLTCQTHNQRFFL